MNTSQLYNELNYVNHSREKRLYYANLVLENPNLIAPLLDILFCVDDKNSPRAAWVLEFMCKENLIALLPHLNTFTKNMSLVHLDAAVRPVAKICEYLAVAYFAKTKNDIQQKLKPKHQKKIIALCFNYLLNDQKIAPKAYAMHTLFLFGTKYKWIYPELALILKRDYQLQSSGFKARARKILQKIKQ